LQQIETFGGALAPQPPTPLVYHTQFFVLLFSGATSRVFSLDLVFLHFI